MGLKTVHHIQVTYPHEVEDAVLSFYSKILGLTEIPRPDVIKNDSGAWYTLGGIELHVSAEKMQIIKHRGDITVSKSKI